ncbi:MAG: lipopolysaccharide kinase InaA family protein [Dysgonomonas sp.]
MLIDKDINTPDPIAYIEERKGIEFSGSFYISVHEQFDGTMRELKFVKMEGQENLMKQFAVFTASMHEKEVLHLDYSPGNILYKKQDDEYSFYLVDLNRMYFGKVPMKEGCKSLRRLWGSDEMIAYIAAEYAKARGFDVGKTVELAMHYHRKFWQEFTRKHPDRQAYIGEVR